MDTSSVIVLLSIIGICLLSLIGHSVNQKVEPKLDTHPKPKYVPPPRPIQYSIAKSYEFYINMTKQDVLNAISFYVRENFKYHTLGTYGGWNVDNELKEGKINYMTDNQILNHVYIKIEHSQNQKGIKTETWVFGTKNSGNTFKFTEDGILKHFTIKNLPQFYVNNN